MIAQDTPFAWAGVIMVGNGKSDSDITNLYIMSRPIKDEEIELAVLSQKWLSCACSKVRKTEKV